MMNMIEWVAVAVTVLMVLVVIIDYYEGKQ